MATVDLKNPIPSSAQFQEFTTQNPSPKEVVSDTSEIELAGKNAILGAIGHVAQTGIFLHNEGIRDEFEQELESEITDFASQPVRLNILQETEQRLERARAAGPRGPAEQARVAKLEGDLQRVQNSFQRGAMSSTELAMRRNAMLRSAIAENPRLAPDFISIAEERFGLYNPELSVIDDQLEGMTTADEPSAFTMRFLEQVQDLGFQYDIAVPDIETAAEMAEPLMRLHGRFQTLERNVKLSNAEREINANQAQQLLPDYVNARFIHTKGQIHSVLDADPSEMSDQEKLQTLRTLKSSLRQDARNQFGAWLGNDVIDSTLDPALQIFEYAEGVVQGTFKRERLDNQFQGLVLGGSIAAAKGDPSLLALASVQKLMGDTVILDLMQAQSKNLQDTMDGITRNITRALYGEGKFTASEVKNYRPMLEQLFATIGDHTELQVPQEDATTSAVNVIEALIPDKTDITEIELKKFKEALPLLAQPEVKDMVDKLELSQNEFENVNNKLNNYLSSVVVPNLRETMRDEKITLFKEPQTPGPGLGGRMPQPYTSATALNLVQPVWSRDGSLSFEVNQSKLTDEIRENPQSLDRVRNIMSKLNRVYAREWNQIMRASTNLDPNADLAQVSQQSWQIYMGDIGQETEEDGE